MSGANANSFIRWTFVDGRIWEKTFLDRYTIYECREEQTHENQIQIRDSVCSVFADPRRLRRSRARAVGRQHGEAFSDEYLTTLENARRAIRVRSPR